MSDISQAITMQEISNYNLQQKLEKTKFIDPLTGQSYQWKKSVYLKKLSKKAKQALN